MRQIEYIELSVDFLSELNYSEKHAFALFLILKYKFVNGHIRNYSTNRIAELAGVSKYVADKYVKIIIRKHWAKIENGTLTLFGKRKIGARNSTRPMRVMLKLSKDIKQIVEDIQFLIFERNAKSQEFRLTIKGYQQQRGSRDGNITKTQYKRLRRIEREKPKWLEGTYNDCILIGLRRLAKILKCSVSTAQKFLRKLVDNKIIETSEVIEKIGKADSNFSPDFLNCFGYTFYFKGNIYLHKGTSISFYHA